MKKTTQFLTLFSLLLLLTNCKKTEEVVVEENSENTTESRLDLDVKELTEATIASGKLYRIEKFPSEFISARNVDIWLPNNYNTKEKFKVLYMHDGQMLFDSLTTWNKQEWAVDEVLSGLIDSAKVPNTIVVAIHNIQESRHADYFPQKAFEMMPKELQDSLLQKAKEQVPLHSTERNADDYLKFITKELKPYIDTNYAVLTNRENTAIAGSSMGGLISMYAICEYPKIFGAAGCISTHWPGAQPAPNNPIPRYFFQYLEDNIPNPETHKFYFDYGTTTLDEHYPQYAPEVDRVFKEKGYDETNFKNLKFEGAAHTENAWKERLHIPFEFILN